MRQKRRVDADEGGDGIDFRQHLVHLLDGDTAILGARVADDLRLVERLIRIQRGLRRDALLRQQRRQAGEVDEALGRGTLARLGVDDDVGPAVPVARHLLALLVGRLGVRHVDVAVLVAEAVRVRRDGLVGVDGVELVADQAHHGRLQATLAEHRAAIAQKRRRARELHREEIPLAAVLGLHEVRVGLHGGDGLAGGERALHLGGGLVLEEHAAEALVLAVGEPELVDDLPGEQLAFPGRVVVGGDANLVCGRERLLDGGDDVADPIGLLALPRELGLVPRQIGQAPARMGGHLRRRVDVFEDMAARRDDRIAFAAIGARHAAERLGKVARGGGLLRQNGNGHVITCSFAYRFPSPLRALLVLDVTLGRGVGRADGRGDEVAVGPKRRDAALHPRELQAQVMARTGLDALDRLVDGQLRVDLEQQLDMVGRDLHLDDVEAEVGRDLAGYLPEALVDPVHQDGTAVLRAEDHVVPAAADDVSVALAFHAGIIPCDTYMS